MSNQKSEDSAVLLAENELGSYLIPHPSHPPSPEIDGPKDPEPTRYGDWEIKGKCVDF